MEEFLFWVVLIFRALKYLLPFLIGGFAAILAFKLLGRPPFPYLIPLALFIILMIGFELKAIFRDIS
jgi:hypothetical protein